MSSYDEESLRKMSYSALKKHAKERGIKVNMKADNLIALILEQTKKDEDSFVTLERSIINSCKKNKENLFDKDKEVPSETPRRDTYTVTSPLKNIELLNDSLVMVSASPELKKPVRDESLNITLSRGSEKKSQRSRKVSFVTPLRKSSRLSSATPQFNSVKDRPKTPMPTRLSSSKKHVSFKNQDNDSVVGCLNLDVSECNDSTNLCNKKVRRPSTPMPLSRRRSTRLSSAAVREELCTSPDFKSTPKPKLILQQLEEEAQEPSSTKDKTDMTPLSSLSSSKKAKALVNESKTDITPLASLSSSKKAKALVNESKTDATPLTSSSSSKKAKALANEGSKVVTPLSSSLSSKKAKALDNDDNADAKPLKSFSSKKSKELVSKPTEKEAVLTEPHSVKKTIATSSIKRKQLTPMHASLFSQRTSPRFGVKTPVPSGLSLSSKKTPNFNKLHQHQFDKMESIDDYQKRKAQTSAKKHKEQLKYHYPNKSNNLKKIGAEKIKKSPNAFPGVPFIPSTNSTKAINFGKSLRLKTKSTIETTKSVSKNDGTLAKKLAVADTVKKVKSVTRENTPLKQRHKFDLKASLAKKLPYKPHTGPIKPLTEVSLNNTIQVAPSAVVKKKENENIVIKAARAESREVLRGVRKNKRFLLQMNNRKLNMSIQ